MPPAAGGGAGGIFMPPKPIDKHDMLVVEGGRDRRAKRRGQQGEKRMISEATLRAVRYDLCESCTMPRSDRHHEPGYRMERTPYDIPAHAFKEPGRCEVCGHMLEASGPMGTEDGKAHDTCRSAK